MYLGRLVSVINLGEIYVYMIFYSHNSRKFYGKVKKIYSRDGPGMWVLYARMQIKFDDDKKTVLYNIVE